jgi:hypothetical protein
MIREDRASAGSGGDTSAGGANQPRGQLRRAAALDVGEHSATARNTTPLNIDQFSALIKDLMSARRAAADRSGPDDVNCPSLPL